MIGFKQQAASNTPAEKLDYWKFFILKYRAKQVCFQNQNRGMLAHPRFGKNINYSSVTIGIPGFVGTLAPRLPGRSAIEEWASTY